MALAFSQAAGAAAARCAPPPSSWPPGTAATQPPQEIAAMKPPADFSDPESQRTFAAAARAPNAPYWSEHERLIVRWRYAERIDEARRGPMGRTIPGALRVASPRKR